MNKYPHQIELYLPRPIGNLYVVRYKKDLMPGGDIKHIWVLTFWKEHHGVFMYALKNTNVTPAHGFFEEFLNEAEAEISFNKMFKEYVQ